MNGRLPKQSAYDRYATAGIVTLVMSTHCSCRAAAG